MRKIRKALGALLGGVTGAGITVMMGAVDVQVAPEVASALATLAGALGVWLAPPNCDPQVATATPDAAAETEADGTETLAT